MDNKVAIDQYQLKELAELALSRGTEAAWIRMALDYIDQATAELHKVREELSKRDADAEKWKWLKENDANLVRCEVQRRGYRSTAPGAQKEVWYEHEGWIVSTMPSDAEPFKTMDEAVESAMTKSV